MFELSVKTHFSAAHRLIGYDGACANLHGHNWDVEIFVRGGSLNKIGMLVDFRDIKAAIREVMKELDHCALNQHPPLLVENPTSEHLARYLHRKYGERLNSDACQIYKITVCETPGTTASYWDED